MRSSRRLGRWLCLGVAGGLAAAAANAATHCVPNAFSASCDDTHTTIQDAIDDSVAGDTVLVAPGTYAENLILDVDITLAGAQAGVDARGRVAGAPNPASESIVAPAAGVGLTLVTGSAGATLDGFSLLGVTNAITSTSGPLDGLLLQNNHIAGFTGAGVFLNHPGTDVTATRNVIDGAAKPGGGGLFQLDTDAFAGFRLEDNVLRNGASATGFFVDGNENLVASAARAPRLAGNLVVDNGVGMLLGSRSFDGGVNGAFIENNTFESNTFDGLQGGPQNATIQNNVFRDNGRSGLALTSFGNTAADRGAQNTTVTCNEFSGNVAEAIFFSASQAAGTIATNQVNQNNIAGATGATYNGTETIDVEDNWWGSATGPTVASNPGGTGAALAGTGSASFDYTPFLAFTALCVPGQPAPDLAVDKAVSDAAPAEGDAVTFTVTLSNLGGPATSVSLSDLLPAGVSYSSHVASQGTYTPGTGVWNVGTIPSPGGGATLEIFATVDAGTAGSTITNTATLTASTPDDAASGNDSADASLVVVQPDLSITKTAEPTLVQPGVPVTFTIAVTNSGDGDATSVTVEDLLPAGSSYVSSDPSQGSYDPVSGVWTLGALPAAASATLEIVADVTTSGEAITNVATITGSTPADASSDDDVAAVAVFAAALVPSLSFFGLALLAATLVAVALHHLRR